MKNRRRGITLVGLVVTIIVLLILAGISINFVLNTNLIERVALAKEPNEIESIRERLELAKGNMYIDNKGKSDIDLYFASLNKYNIKPYILTKTEKMSDKVGIVEVDNKYSFLIKFKNNIEIEYEGKIDEIKRKESVIGIKISGETQQDTFPISLNAEVTGDGEIVTNGKWILNKESEKIGTDEKLYTGNIAEDSINIEIEQIGEYYLHILTTDTYDRAIETIEGPITVSNRYHEHTGNATSGGGCYTKGIHNHVSSCTKRINIYLDNYNNQWWYHPSTGSRHYGASPNGKMYSWSGIAGDISVYQEDTNAFCGSPVNAYSLGCSKTTDSIEGATIKY